MDNDKDDENLRIAQSWCNHKGAGWSILDEAGRGGTAPVFTVESPGGPLALKLYDKIFSSGIRGEESERRLRPQLGLGLHDCPHLVRVHDGGRFEDRIFVLMDKASGNELEKILKEVPREKVRGIVDRIARAAIFLREKGLSHRDIKSANIFVSDDFESVTLLDLSVLRDVDDPVGLGTDHGEQLPVVATSRYSPPEYLFRLVEPSRELWHALDIYQLGGVLHDLIMREPMFEAEYQKTRETNRYRFAWIVATQDPVVSAPDIDRDLIHLARRALDKDWTRRSSLRLEDFLDEPRVHQEQALQALGANIRRDTTTSQSSADIIRAMDDISREIEDSISLSLRAIGITAVHQTSVGSTASTRDITFRWAPEQSATSDGVTNVEFIVSIGRHQSTRGISFTQKARLLGTVALARKMVEVELPDILDGGDLIVDLVGAAMASLQRLATQLVQAK